jgi:hypothetical protein
MINLFVPRRPSVSKLSKLQKRILEEGLKAHWHRPIHRALGSKAPGVFGISKILHEFFGLSKEDTKRRRGSHSPVDRQRPARAARAAISRAMSRLARRGFLERIEPTGRGSWRLSTPRGRSCRTRLPLLQKPTRTGILQKLKEAFLQQQTIRKALGRSDSVTLKDFIASGLEEQREAKGVKVELVGLD